MLHAAHFSTGHRLGLTVRVLLVLLGFISLQQTYAQSAVCMRKALQITDGLQRIAVGVLVTVKCVFERPIIDAE